jgi:uncharacterized cupin superfamily protein
MSRVRYLLFPVLLLAGVAVATDFVFPRDHPLDMRKAQKQGLHRLSAEELRSFMPGSTYAMQGGSKKRKIRVYHPDGSFEGGAFQKRRGTWRVDSKGDTWCRIVVIKMQDQDKCFAVFRAPDGVHYFDYDMTDGFYVSVWRPIQK